MFYARYIGSVIGIGISCLYSMTSIKIVRPSSQRLYEVQKHAFADFVCGGYVYNMRVVGVFAR